MQLPDRIIVYELSGDDPTDMRYRVKVRGKGGGGGFSFPPGKIFRFCQSSSKCCKAGLFPN